MSAKQLSIEDLRTLINEGKANDPLVFLECVMNGQDPRELSKLYKLVCEVDEFTSGQPSEEDWSEIVDLVMSTYKYQPVSLGQSVGASKTLAEYLHAKRKQVELNGNLTEGKSVQNNPLTEEEIILFKERFNEEF